MVTFNWLNRAVLIAALIAGAGASGPAAGQAGPEYGVLLKGAEKLRAPQFPSIPSPAPGQPKPQIGDIAFIANGDVYTVTLDGQHFQQLTTDGRNAFPIWSPNGRYIAFSKAGPPPQAGASPNASLWVVTADGKYAKPVVNAVQNEAIYPVAWLPDSSGLLAAVHYLETDVEAVLRVVTLDGKPYAPYQKWIEAAKKAGFLHQLAAHNPDELGHGQAGAFSPDGREIVFTGATQSVTDGPRLDLFGMSTDGSRLRRLTELPNISLHCLRWSPRRNRLLSSELRELPGGKSEAGIWLRSADGKVIRKLADTKGPSFSGMDWSPRGDYIIFQVSDAKYPRFEHPSGFRDLSSHSSVWLMKADGTGKYKLSDNACQPNWKKARR
jgi:Tol biopolymer transport system component